MKMLFGKTGSGKSFIGDYLQNHYGFTHFDGDLILTEKMKDFMRREEKFTPEMVDEYTKILKEKIKFLYENDQGPTVISQGLYRNKNRLDILQQFPKIEFIFIHADEPICYHRIEKRQSWVSVNYAKKISELFEPIQGFNYITLINNNDIQSLDAQIKEKLNIMPLF
jgi:gluconate kinase